MKKLISVVLVAVMLLALLPAALTVNADTYSGTCGQNVTWSLDTSTGVLTISGTGNMRDYALGYPGFYTYRNDITSVVIENGVTAIGNYAFYNLTNMASVTIPNSVTSIIQRAFRSCTSLTSVTIPNSVTLIGSEAFSGCSSLSTIRFEGSAPTIDSDVFSGVTATAYYTWGDVSWTESVRKNYGGYITWVPVYPSGTCGDNVTWSLDPSTGVLTISGTGDMWDFSDDYPGFYDYKDYITSVVIENGVTSIGRFAFFELSKIASVTIPNSVTSIGDYAFEYCSGLKSVTIGNSVLLSDIATR